MKLKTIKDYLLFREEANPFIERKTKSGIVTSVADLSYDSEESGRTEKIEAMIGFGVVTAVGDQVIGLKIGDGIYYDRRSIRPVPFGKLNTWHINQGNIVSYLEDEDGSIQAAIDLHQEEQAAEQRKASFIVPAGFGSGDRIN